MDIELDFAQKRKLPLPFFVDQLIKSSQADDVSALLFEKAASHMGKMFRARRYQPMTSTAKQRIGRHSRSIGSLPSGQLRTKF